MAEEYKEMAVDAIIRKIVLDAATMTTGELDRISEAVTDIRDERMMRTVVDRCASAEGIVMGGESFIRLTIPEARATARLLRRHGYGIGKQVNTGAPAARGRETPTDRD